MNSKEQFDLKEPLIIKELNIELWPIFSHIHNEGFKQVPNGGLLEEDERDDLIKEYARNPDRLLLFYEGDLPVAIAMLKVDCIATEIELEALSVNPVLHGKGYGRRALKTLMRELNTWVSAVSSMHLMVMDTNQRAFNLYLSERFIIKRVEVKRYAGKSNSI